jgi:L-rhamnose isomerase
MNRKPRQIEASYRLAKEYYAAMGVNTDKVLKVLETLPVSMHCWQGDDVTGFERSGSLADGGLMATGNYPGKARTPAELRMDLTLAYSLIPGHHRLNLHSIYAETAGKRVERNDLEFRHFAGWVAWARELGIGMDFNPSCFAHPKAADGFTLSNRDKAIRTFWIEHCQACREISAQIGKALKSPCVTNVWVPDGYKDTPADRLGPRLRLKESLDRVFARRLDPRHHLDSVESKLFGIGSESYVVGSHEFYLSYAIRNRTVLCLDTGHFHPTETISDKLSAILIYLDRVLLHVSRGIRWDSDHVVTLTDDLRSISEELVRGGFLGRVHIGLDYFDASINRIAAWVVGMRSMIKSLLLALLEPRAALQKHERAGDLTSRLALIEELKTLPAGAVWDHYCLQQDVPVGMAWMDEVKTYEKNVQSKR